MGRLKFLCLSGSKYEIWCGQRDSNSHGLGPHGPQPCLSTNFSMAANMTHIKSMTRRFQIDKFQYGIYTRSKKSN